MSTTIFCTFEQQDLADLAMGELRSTTAGIKSIHYVSGFNTRNSALNSSAVNDSWTGLFPFRNTMDYSVPSKPINVRIVCSDVSANAVKARLVNLRAYQIITMR